MVEVVGGKELKSNRIYGKTNEWIMETIRVPEEDFWKLLEIDNSEEKLTKWAYE